MFDEVLPYSNKVMFTEEEYKSWCLGKNASHDIRGLYKKVKGRGIRLPDGIRFITLERLVFSIIPRETRNNNKLFPIFKHLVMGMKWLE